MKITDVEAICLSLYEIEEKADGTQDALIVKVHTDEGIVGFGEVDSSPQVAKAIIEAPTSHSLCHGLKSLVIGENPFEIDRIWEKMYRGTIYYGRRGPVLHAMSGIDIALWDIVGKATGKPVYELLGGGYRQRIRAYASSLFGATPDETRRLAHHYIHDMGFTAIKFGWDPMGQDEKTDIALVREARRGAGDEADIMVDAGLCWDAKTAIQRARRFQEYNIFWLEEPLPPDDIEGYARLSEAVDVRIAAGEEESSRAGFKELIERGKIDVVQVDVTRAGGLTESRKIASMAHEHNLPCVNHSFTTGINIAASLHLLASIPNAFILEYSVSSSPIREETTIQKFEVVNGYLEIPSGPGLGVELNEDTIQKYRWPKK